MLGYFEPCEPFAESCSHPDHLATNLGNLQQTIHVESNLQSNGWGAVGRNPVFCANKKKRGCKHCTIEQLAGIQ
jgi:hypothetical protein